MDEINLIQSWSRYNNKVQGLQQALGLPLLQNSEKVGLDPKWVTYNSQVQELQTKLGIHTHKIPQQLTFNTSVPQQADDPSGEAKVSKKQYTTGLVLERELLRHYGLSAVHSMMERYQEGTSKKTLNAPPAQDVVDKVLITRRIAHTQHRKNLDDAIRKLEATKGSLKKELKNLKAQNEFFGNGRISQAGEPHTLRLSSDPRVENKNTKLVVTDLLNGLEKDESLMDDIIEEVMSSNLSYQPQKRDPATSQRIQKLTLETSVDRAILLTGEEIILEVTSEMCEEAATEVFKRTTLSLEFEKHFDSRKVQEYLKSSNPLDF